MAIMASLYTGVSGLSANGRALSVIGDNIANVNTTGFKGSRAIFGDILSQALGGGGALQVGRGVMLMGIQQIHTQGTLETTANPLDLAIEGDGFFIVRDAAGAQYYTRAGQFRLDREGNIVNPEGLELQGNLIRQDGMPEFGTINVAALNSPPQATGSVIMSANLNSATPVKDPTTQQVFAITSDNNRIRINGVDHTILARNYTGVELATALSGLIPGLTFTYNPPDAPHRFRITNTGAAVTINWDHSVTPSNNTIEQLLGFRSVAQPIATGATVTGDFDAVGFDATNALNTSDEPRPSITVFDSLGNSHLINIHFRKTAEGTTITGGETGNRWHWYAVVPSASSLTGQPQVGAQGFLEFNTAGRLVADIQEFNDFNFVGTVTTPQVISFDFGRSITEGDSGLLGSTQFGSPAAVLFQSQNGFTAGNLMNLIVEQDGVMTGIFTNGQVQRVADVVLARFIAPTMLTKLGRNLFAESHESGSSTFGTAGTAGRGRIFANSLEASNIDLADEFVKMIAAQRGFQANTRVITTADDLLTELMRIMR